MTKYAEGTTVSVEQSQFEIKRLCLKHGAGAFTMGDDGRTGGGVEFEMRERRIRFVVRYPDPTDRQFTFVSGSSWQRRPAAAAKVRHEAEVRRLWRVLLLTIKSKLEAVENGLVSFEEEMLAYMVVPGSGRTVGDWLVPQLDEVYRSQRLPPLLGAGVV